MRLVSVVIVLIALMGFSVFAHNIKDKSISDDLKEQLTALELEHEKLKLRLAETRLVNNQNWQEAKKSMLLLFPGEDNRLRIENFFDPPQPEEPEVEAEATEEDINALAEGEQE